MYREKQYRKEKRRKSQNQDMVGMTVQLVLTDDAVSVEATRLEETSILEEKR